MMIVVFLHFKNKVKTKKGTASQEAVKMFSFKLNFESSFSEYYKNTLRKLVFLIEDPIKIISILVIPRL